MNGWAFAFILIGVAVATSWVFKLVDLIEAPRKRRRRADAKRRRAGERGVTYRRNF